MSSGFTAHCFQNVDFHAIHSMLPKSIVKWPVLLLIAHAFHMLLKAYSNRLEHCALRFCCYANVTLSRNSNLINGMSSVRPFFPLLQHTYSVTKSGLLCKLFMQWIWLFSIFK